MPDDDDEELPSHIADEIDSLEQETGTLTPGQLRAMSARLEELSLDLLGEAGNRERAARKSE